MRSTIIVKYVVKYVAAFAVLISLQPAHAFAVAPVVKTVPWVASNLLIPHDTYAGKTITLKGTSDVAGATIEYTWDFGDSTAPLTGTVIASGTPTGNQRRNWAIEAAHSYTGAVGTVFTARLTVRNTTVPADTATKTYLIKMQAKNLAVEANIAIDEGLWYLHKTMNRTTVGGVSLGDWMSCPYGSCYNTAGYHSLTANNLHAFLVNGHAESGSPDNPYTETVARAMRRVFQFLATTPVPSSQTNPNGSFNPDTNGNGYGVWVPQGDYFYQAGMVMDAIIAANTPNNVTTTGQAPSGSNPGILGRTYRSIAQDMADYYLYCQYDGSPYGGGWYYSCNGWVDNSISQWAAIGLIAAERTLGVSMPLPAKLHNRTWLTYSQNAAGYFGYQSSGAVWGPFATTPSGMVQLTWNGLGRGAPLWDKAETYMRNYFGNPTAGPTNNPKDYYYGLFSLTKSMMLHDSNGDGLAEPITLFQSSTPGVNPIDWYSAERNMSLPEGNNNTDGVARTLINDQNAAGFWYGHNYYGPQQYFETGWAIIMLNRTLFEAGAPVAVAEATPNPAVAFQTIILNGGDSFHQDPNKDIDSWEWDLDNDGFYDDASGVTATVSFPTTGNRTIGLKVTDDASPEASATTSLIINVNTPPVAPTAEAGGPYNFCIDPLNVRKWFLDGSGSSNPDNGQSEPGRPADYIKAYEWDLNGDPAIEATGVAPNVTNFWGVGSYLVQLKCTDNTASSFPSSGQPDLSDTDTAQVVVRASTDPLCACVSNLLARPKMTKAELTWTPHPGAHHHNIYRGVANGGPYLKIAEVSGTTNLYLDNGPLTIGTTYYYVVRPAQLNNTEICQSNQTSARPTGR